MKKLEELKKAPARSQIVVQSEDEKARRRGLFSKQDTGSERLKRYLSMPDLSRTAESPIHALVERIVAISRFSGFDIIKVPEIVDAHIGFDLFNFSADHPARSHSDTYYIDDKNILRTHTTIMWYYYLNDPGVKKLIQAKKPVGSLCYGKVYRKDEIDRNHMNVFHQMDGWYLAPKSEGVIAVDDLKEVLIEIAQAIFGKDIEYRFNKDSFPYTDPSIEMEIKKGDRWVEVLGAGVVRAVVLKNLGMNADEYTGWAFGFGLERLAILSMELPDIRLLWSSDPRIKKQLVLGQTYVPVSKYPEITRDISFVVNNDFMPNNYFDLIRDIGGDLVEEVTLLDKYENSEKFGKDKISYTYRITYRSQERTLLSEEVDVLQDALYQETKKQYNAELR
ncbi:MAG: hypothetical protein Q8O83_05430 [bacterium]|nr:hypothetical protein [bacterium]